MELASSQEIAQKGFLYALVALVSAGILLLIGMGIMNVFSGLAEAPLWYAKL